MVQYTLKGSELYVQLDGELDHHSAVDVRTQIDALIDRYPKADNLRLNVGGLTFMDSSGIGVVIGRYKKMNARGGKVTVDGASGRVDTIFKMSGLYDIIKKA